MSKQPVWAKKLGTTAISAKAFGVVGDGVTDDTADLQTAITTCASVGARLRMPPGTYLVSSPLVLSPFSCIEGADVEKTKILSTVAAGPPLNAPLFGSSAFGTAGTLASSPTLYGNTITSTTVMAVGSWLELQSALPTTTLHIATYQVIGKSGGGPTFTYTLDRSILRPFTMGDTVLPILVPLIGVRLSRFSMTGTGTRGINMICAIRCLVEDVVMDASGGSIFGEGGSFDDSGFESQWRRVRIVGGGAVNHGLLAESGERMAMVDCSTDDCTGSGQSLWDCYASEIRNPKGSGNNTGVELGGDSALTVGSNACRCIGGAMAGSTVDDYEIGRSQSCSIVDASSSGAGLVGINIDPPVGALAQDVTITGGSIVDANTTSVGLGGAILAARCDGLAINGVAIERPQANGVRLSAGTVRVSGNVGIIKNVVAAAGQRVGLYTDAAGITGKIVGLVVDTSQIGVRFDAASPGLAIDQWDAINCANRVVNGQNAVVDGVLHKADGATTVDVTNVRSVVCADTAVTTITNPMVNAYDGQFVTYTATTSNTRVDRSNAYLAGGVNWSSAPAVGAQAGAQTLALIFQSGLNAAVELARVNTNQ